MKTIFPLSRSLLTMSVLVSLAACASTQSTPSEEEYKVHHPDTSSSQAPGGGNQQSGQMGMMSGSSDGMTSSMDPKAMCDMHKKMMNASPSERQAMMNDWMKQMSPEMRERHMQMMQEQCK